MNELKVRVWDGKKMHHDVRIGVNNGKPIFLQVFDKKIGRWINLFGYDFSKVMYFRCKDKNKKDVYDGDVVIYRKHIYTDCSKTKLIKVEKPIIGEFYFAEGLWPGLRFGNGTGMLFLPGDLDSEIEFEKIGNVYENPELLKEGVHS